MAFVPRPMTAFDLKRLTSRMPDGTGELIRLAWPVVLARLGIMVMGLTDAIVVGQYSARELGYHALGWAPTSVVLTTAVGLLTGVQVMTARHLGEGRRDLTGGVMRRGLVYGFWIGVLSMVGLIAAGPLFLHNAGLERDLADGASRALIVFSLSLPLYLVSVVLTFYLEALSKPKAGMIVMWLANGVNLALNLLFVPGLVPFVEPGAVGSAWATFGARLFLMIGLIVYVLRLREARELGIFDKPRTPRGEGWRQIEVGLGAGASYFVEVSAFAAMTIFAGQLGGEAVAGWNIVLNVAAIIFMGPLGLATATAVMVGRAYGARDAGGVWRSGVIGLAVTGALTFAVCLIVWPGAELIARAYTQDDSVVALAAGALVLSCLFFVADGLQVVAAQALRARGDVWLPTASHLLSYAAIMLPLGWVFANPMGMGVDGIVWAVIVASLLSAILLCGRFWMLRERLPAG